MDPVTGLSRRARRILLVVVVLGIAASTVAQIGRAAPGCPDERYGCAASHEGEAVVLGVLVTEDRAGELTDLDGIVPDRFLGRPLRLAVWEVSCTARDGSRGARELGSDPLDAPPVFAVIMDACEEAFLPAAQILADVGIPVVALELPAQLPVTARTTLDGSELEASGGVAALPATVLEAAEELAITREEDVLIPRTPLLRALVARGLAPVPTETLAAPEARP